MTKIKVEFEFEEMGVRNVDLVKESIAHFVHSLFGHAEVMFTKVLEGEA